MGFSNEVEILPLTHLSFGLLVAALFCTAFVSAFRAGKYFPHNELKEKVRPSLSVKREPVPIRQTAKLATEQTAFSEMELYKGLYFKLQHLEDYPEVIPIAKQSLLWLLSEGLKDFSKNREDNILSIRDFDKDKLAKFLSDHHQKVTESYKEYIAQRQSGGARQLVRDREDAERWLRKIAPLKLVDGAWLGHFNKITMPFALRPIVKQTWQIFTEELGDGNINQHHVYIFEELLKQFEPMLPSPMEKEILHPRYKFDSLKYWRMGAAQLMISLFPNEFLPEILGFNMHFEMLQLDTMQAAKELPEVGLDPYYFLLHVSIDNCHSGHAAMSMNAPVNYIQHILETEGEEAAQIVWRRVQTGYIFSEWLGQKDEKATDIPLEYDNIPCDKLEAQVLKIFSAKAHAAHGLHCGCKAKIKNRSLDDWLDPVKFTNEEWQYDFLRSLSTSKPWIYPGDSNKSRLVTELRWGGKMFGSFTRDEVCILAQWIDSMRPHRIPYYYDFAGFAAASHCQGCGVSNSSAVTADKSNVAPALKLETTVLAHTLHIKQSSDHPAADIDLSLLIPLWHTQPCLLESFVYAPARTADKLGSAVLCLLRAQFGFQTESPIATGIHEPYGEEAADIVSIGLEMIERASLQVPPDLKSLLARWPSEFSEKMLQLSSKPLQNFSVLLGMSMAMLELQETVAKDSGSGLLSPQSYINLQALVRRQYHYLQECYKCISSDEKAVEEFSHGYRLARSEVQKCFKNQD